MHKNSKGGFMNISIRQRINISSDIFKSEKNMFTKIMTVGLFFENNKDPYDYIWKIMNNFGYKNPDELRTNLKIPEKRLICVDLRRDKKIETLLNKMKKEEILRNALILGLCSKYFYDSDRPIIWISSSLRRIVSLYDIGGFYD